MSDDGHWHYASDIHGGAEEHHRHHDLENTDEHTARRITDLQSEVGVLRGQLADALARIEALEKSAPETQPAPEREFRLGQGWETERGGLS